MHVVVLTNMYPTELEPWYGIFVKDQTEDLRALGVEVELLAFDGRRRSSDYIRASMRLRRLLAGRDVDLIHAHYGLTGAVALTQRRVPVVTTFHGSDCSGEVPWQSVVSWAVARLSTPIFVGAHLAQRLRLQGAAVIPAAVDTQLFRPIDRRAARRALGWEEDGTYALLPGSRSNRLKRAELFDAALEHARRRLPDLLGVSLEGVSREEVMQVMNAADVTVMTSDNEGSPVTVKESLACCTPVVSVPVGDVAALLPGLPGCFVVPREPRRLAGALVAAVGSGRPEDLRRAAERYSRPRIARRVLEVYERAFQRARRRGSS